MKKNNTKTLVALLATCFVFSLAGPVSALAAMAPSLGTAASFSVLASPSMTAANPTTVSGDLGLSTGLAGSLTGTWTVGGTEYFGPSSLAATAQTDASNASTILAGETSSGTWSLNPAPLPGVWTAVSSAVFPGPTLTLNGSATDVWVFQITSDLTFTGSVNLTGGAEACNVFWQVSRDATIASGSHFVGTLIAGRDVTVVSGATVNGRILAGRALTTDGNSITGPTCGALPATLHVIKLPVGGTTAASGFTMHVKNSSNAEVGGGPFSGAASPGTTYSLPAGNYTISEDPNASYAQSFTWDVDSCAGGNITLSPGDNTTCTVVNTYSPSIPPPAPASSVSVGGGARLVPVIGILKVPTPLALPSGSGPVTYNYTVWNEGGQVPLVNVSVTDDKCSPVTYLSGDTNNNGILDPGEQWKYSCTITLATTTTNTSIATGYGDDSYHQAAIATAIATVVVGASTPPPLINIVKVPSRLTPFPFGGGNVTYTYKVTNPGVVAMNNVTVTDDKCAPVTFVSGDTNGNNLLDPGEAWTYTCSANIPISTRNVATAEGKANGFTAMGYAFSTVLVAAPSLPNTGFPPETNGTLLRILELGSILLLVSASVLLVLKRRRI